MKTPTLEELKKHFENAKIVKSLYGGIYEYEGGVHFHQGAYFCKTTGTDCIIWEKTKGYAEIIEYKQQKFEITKEQIIILNTDGNKDIRKCIQEWFPKAFETVLEVGKWYKHSSISDYLVLYTGKNEAVGFMDGSWYSHLLFGSQRLKQGCVEATTEEVTEALKNEAEKRYKAGYYIENLGNYFNGNSNMIFGGEDFCIDSDGSFCVKSTNNYWIRLVDSKGQWAEIIPSKKMTHEEIEKELGYKIEIV